MDSMKLMIKCIERRRLPLPVRSPPLISRDNHLRNKLACPVGHAPCSQSLLKQTLCTTYIQRRAQKMWQMTVSGSLKRASSVHLFQNCSCRPAAAREMR